MFLLLVIVPFSLIEIALAAAQGNSFIGLMHMIYFLFKKEQAILTCSNLLLISLIAVNSCSSMVDSSFIFYVWICCCSFLSYYLIHKLSSMTNGIIVAWPPVDILISMEKKNVAYPWLVYYFQSMLLIIFHYFVIF